LVRSAISRQKHYLSFTGVVLFETKLIQSLVKRIDALTMSDAADKMKKALKQVVVPRLRERSFTGSFPHLRRRQTNRIDLLTFQFDRYGGGFIIEIGQCSPDGYTTYWGKQIAANKVTAWDLSPKERARVQSRHGPAQIHGFGSTIWSFLAPLMRCCHSSSRQKRC
jgi:uncharacterized protein DUF4304